MCAKHGPPALVIEAASTSTWRYDVNLESTRRGKRQAGKRQAGKAFGFLVLLRIPEYLVFDPRGEFIPGQVRAWRGVGDVVRVWEPEADGRYYSQELGISFRPDGPLLRVYDADGRPVPYWFEVARDNAMLRQQIADMEEELERLRRQ